MRRIDHRQDHPAYALSEESQPDNAASPYEDGLERLRAALTGNGSYKPVLANYVAEPETALPNRVTGSPGECGVAALHRARIAAGLLGERLPLPGEHDLPGTRGHVSQRTVLQGKPVCMPE